MAAVGSLVLVGAVLYFLFKSNGLQLVLGLFGSVTPKVGPSCAPSVRPVLATGWQGDVCAGYDPVPAFLDQAEDDFKKHVDERMRRMGTTLPSLEDLLKLGNAGPHLPTRQQLEARMLVPTFSCAVEEHLGAWGQGKDGKWVCTSYLRGDAAGTPPVAVSVRVGSENTTFEEAVFEVLRVKPHLFDPLLTAPFKPYVVGHEKEGVAGISGLGVARQEYPDARWHSVAGLMQVLQGDKAGTSPLDLLALDCGGCEDSVVQELHATQAEAKGPRFRQLVMRLTAVDDVALTMRVLLRVEALGYRLFHAEKDAYNANRYQASLE